MSEAASAEGYKRLRATNARAARAVRTTDLPDETVEAMRKADLPHLPTD